MTQSMEHRIGRFLAIIEDHRAELVAFTFLGGLALVLYICAKLTHTL